MLVRTGRGGETEAELKPLLAGAAQAPTCRGEGGEGCRLPPPLGIVDDLSAAADLIIHSLGTPQGLETTPQQASDSNVGSLEPLIKN